jgi:hypothetical protein
MRAALFGAIVFAGCITADVMRLSPRTLPPNTASIEVITTATTKRYTELAVIRITGRAAPWKDLVARAQTEAGKLGADAIIITENTTYSEGGGMSFGKPAYSAGTTPVDLLVATAIVYEGGTLSIRRDDTPHERKAPVLDGSSEKDDGSYLSSFTCPQGPVPVGERLKVYPQDVDASGVRVQTQGGRSLRVAAACVPRVTDTSL